VSAISTRFMLAVNVLERALYRLYGFLRAPAEVMSPEARLLLLLIPGCVAGVGAFFSWLFISGRTGLVMCLAAAAFSVLHLAIGGLVMFVGPTAVHAIERLAELDEQRGTLRTALRQHQQRANERAAKRNIRRTQAKVLAREQAEQSAAEAKGRKELYQQRLSSAEGICPRCGSKDIAPVKRGYNSDAGACGCLLLGPLGLLFGLAGSGKTRLVCLGCGHEWKPGHG